MSRTTEYTYGSGDADLRLVLLGGPVPGIAEGARFAVLLPDGTQLVCASKAGAQAVRDVLSHLVLRLGFHCGSQDEYAPARSQNAPDAHYVDIADLRGRVDALAVALARILPLA